MAGFVIAGIVLLVVIALIASWQAARKRRAEFLEWALLHGLTFSAEKNYGLDSEFPYFQCLRRGEQRFAHNEMRGPWDERPLVAFDYHFETYTTDDKDNRQTQHHHFTAVIMKADVPVKNLRIRAEGVFDKVTAFFGAEDINFESAEFSRKFHVTADDRKWAYDVLHPRAMELLLSSPTFNLEFSEQFVIAWKERRLKVVEIEQAAALVDGLLDLMPDYLLEQQKQEPPALP